MRPKTTRNKRYFEYRYSVCKASLLTPFNCVCCIVTAANQPVDILAVAAGNPNPGVVVPGQKREYTMVGGTVGAGVGNKKKRNKKAKITQGPVIPKNALMQLNEIKPGLVYNVGDHEGMLLLRL